RECQSSRRQFLCCHRRASSPMSLSSKTNRNRIDMVSAMRAIAIAVFAVLPLQQLTSPAVKDVGWIAGCWEFTSNGRHVTEQWTPVEGGTMMGMSRTVAGEKTTDWEFLMIRRGAKGLEYVAKPSGQAEAVFTAATASPMDVVFENPAHDFP